MVAPDTYASAALAVNAVWTLFDQRRYQDIEPYLTLDCAWQRPEGWRHGLDELRTSFSSRPADLLSRHVVTNFTAEEAEDGSLSGRCYVVAYFARTDDLEATQLMDQPQILADVNFEFVKLKQRVLISKISVHQTFAAESLLKK